MSLVIAFAALLVLLGWLLVSGRGDAPEPTVGRRVGGSIDYAELEQAEREARAADDADAVRDWGPGATKLPLG